VAPPLRAVLPSDADSTDALQDRTGLVDGRIFLLSQLYPPDVGGSAVLLHESYSRLGGSAVTVGADAGSHRAGLTVTGAPLVPLPIATPRWGLADPRALAHHVRLAARLRGLTSRSTVIHCGRALPEGIAAWISRLSGGPRYVVWTHGEDVTCALLSREQTFVMGRVYRGASALVANSLNTRRLLEGCGVPSAKIHVVYPGVDAGRFSPRIDGRELRARVAPNADIMLLSVGRLQKRKGHDLAISALAALRRSHPRMTYVIVGDGAERARLEALARDLGVADRVVFAGEASVADLPKYYAACDLFLLPNRIEQGDVEGFGIVFLEAAATGRAVIAGNSGGVPEAVADGQTGLLVSGTDAQELAAAIARLSGDRTLRERLGRAGRARVLASFTWLAAAERVRAIHQSVVEGRA
jgi:phosphatidyl-myo-inositol dimannoside synthase